METVVVGNELLAVQGVEVVLADVDGNGLVVK